jgi:hypothetical protein
MSIHASWDNEAKTVIHSVSHGDWNWEEAYAVTREINTMLASVDHKVDLIIGAEANSRGKIPPNAVSHWHNTYRNLHPNARRIIVVGVNPFVNALLNIIIKVARADNIKMVRTLEEARALVYQADEAEQSVTA